MPVYVVCSKKIAVDSSNDTYRAKHISKKSSESISRVSQEIPVSVASIPPKKNSNNSSSIRSFKPRSARGNSARPFL